MKISKLIARKFVFPVIMNFGFEKILRQFSGNSILNLMYHGVVPDNNIAFSPRHISIEQFEKHLKYLKKNFEILSLPEAFDLYRNGIKTKSKAITISFDDGYKNNLVYALPLLEKYNIKTTFFISGICAEEMEIRALWSELIACLNYFFRTEIIEIEEFRFVNSYDNYNQVKITDYIKSLKPPERELVLAKFVNKYDLHNKLKQIPTEFWELMNKEDIQEIAGSGISEIGSHGYFHYNLGIIGESESEAEMKRSKDLLEGVVNKSIDMIAFPDGSYTNKVKDQATSIGYDKLLAVNYKCHDDPTDKRILNRHGLSTTTTFESNMFFLNKSFISKGYN